jgi:hypothetical protein
MRRWIMTLLLLAGPPCGVVVPIGLLHGTALANPNDLTGGVMITHYVPELVYSAGPPGSGWCEAYGPHAISSLSQVNTQVSTQDSLGVVWYVIAAWESEDKRWCGTEFGLGDYDPAVFLILSAAPCFPVEGLELSTPGWPGPGEGTAFVVTGNPWDGNYVLVYAFGSYAYGTYGAQTLVELDDDPATGSCGFANCLIPPLTYSVTGPQRGALGINTPGSVPVFAPPEAWACCIGFDCVMLIEEDCLSAGGTWYQGYDCEPPNPCEGPGACCISGICENLYEQNCALVGGEFLGQGSDCNPNPCPAVCCYGERREHDCEITLEADCLAGHGFWHPEWTDCNPNPCDTYSPAEKASWGRIKTMYR